MIKVVGYINGKSICDYLPDTPENRRLIQTAISYGLTAAIVRL